MRASQAFVIAAVLIGAAGCNDDGGGGRGTQEIGDLRIRADRICTTAYDELGALRSGADLGSLPTAEDARRFLVERYAPRLDRFVGDLKELALPTKDRSEWEAILADLSDALSAFKRHADADPVAASRQAQAALDAADAGFAAYGFDVCGTG